MKDVYCIADNIFSPLGSTTSHNFMQLINGVSGIQKQNNPSISTLPFFSCLFKVNQPINSTLKTSYTKFENLLIASINDAILKSEINATNKKNILIISTTKGNISLLENGINSSSLQKRMALSTSANLVANHFQFINQPIVISNACISGLLAIIVGMRLIQSGQYENAIIAGADVISKFILSGFQAFQAISDAPCKPFDAARNGISLGEGAGTIILSANKKNTSDLKILSGSVSNDANHISGPSRTGHELQIAISKALQGAKLSEKDISFISAHGTATIYNDEMEAKAITLANLQNVPVNSLKGYYGHTLGAAGLIESIVSIHALAKNVILPTKGFSQLGVSTALNVTTALQKTSLQNCLKTASGFGGCNAAVIFSK